MLKRLFTAKDGKSDIVLNQTKAPTAVVPATAAASPVAAVAPLPEVVAAPQISLIPSPRKQTIDQVVRIQVDTRPVYDVSQLRDGLAALEGVVNGEGLLAVASYDEDLAIQATDLVDGCLRLQSASYSALAHNDNVITLSHFFVEVVNMMDVNASRLGSEHVPVVRRVGACLREACDIAESCSQPGWLVRMAKGEGMSEEFAHLHCGAMALLHPVGLDVAPRASADGKTYCLPDAYYPDVGKSVRKLLKTLGDGNLMAGVQKLRDDEAAQQEVAKMTDTPVEEIQREAAFDYFYVDANSTEIVGDGPARDAESAKTFAQYVTTSEHGITADGLEMLMTHMGLMDAVGMFDRPATARAALVAADSDYDGALNFDEFRAFYCRHPISAVRLHLRMASSLELESRVHEAFLSFSSFGASKSTPRAVVVGEDGGGLECMRFAKLCRDCGLISRGMNGTHVDVVYAASKPRGARRLDFDHFLAALVLVADRRGQTLDQVANMVANGRGPAVRATRPDFVRQHDDPSKIIGISSRGGAHCGPVNPSLGTLVARSAKESPALPPPSGIKPTKVQPTQPSSPRLATQWRVVTDGPRTPGRGAPLKAVEAQAAAKNASLTSPRGPYSVFGRACTPRAAELATTPRSKKKAGSAATPVSKNAKPTQLFKESAVVQAPLYSAKNFYVETKEEEQRQSPPPSIVVPEPSSPSFVDDAVAATNSSSSSPLSAAAFGGVDPFLPASSVAMVSLSSKVSAQPSAANSESDFVDVADNDDDAFVEAPLARSESTDALAAMMMCTAEDEENVAAVESVVDETQGKEEEHEISFAAMHIEENSISQAESVLA